MPVNFLKHHQVGGTIGGHVVPEKKDRTLPYAKRNVYCTNAGID